MDIDSGKMFWGYLWCCLPKSWTRRPGRHEKFFYGSFSLNYQEHEDCSYYESQIILTVQAGNQVMKKKQKATKLNRPVIYFPTDGALKNCKTQVSVRGRFRRIWKTVGRSQRQRLILKITQPLTYFLEKHKKFRHQFKPYLLIIGIQLSEFSFKM